MNAVESLADCRDADLRQWCLILLVFNDERCTDPGFLRSAQNNSQIIFIIPISFYWKSEMRFGVQTRTPTDTGLFKAGTEIRIRV